ncbi:MAG: transglutaminase TgpA family protein, partial [Desulfovermiculus sp.]
SALQNVFISPRFISFLRLPLTVLGLAGVLLFWDGKLGPVSGTALLSLMLGIKSLEIKGSRDQMITVFTALFVLFAAVLFYQSLLMGVYILFTAWILLTALGAVNGQQPRSALRISGLIVAQALPLALVFFVLFPRLPGSLFGLTQNPTSGRTGLSSTLSPGSISQLIPSSSPAFRAEFQGPVPNRNQLYWRAAVLRSYNGKEWTSGREEFNRGGHREPELLESGTSRFDLRMALEPHNSKMLPALDFPSTAPEETVLLSGRILRAKEPVDQTFVYNLSAVPELAWLPLSSAERKACLDIDSGSNPQTREAVTGMFSAQADPKEKLQAILQFFQKHDFAYTLSPPTLPSEDPIDAFLFQTRAGYCEHYAQAAAWMARAAGLPARIVVGYQGGERNLLADFILVRESDAHAWIEVWLPSKGWTRADPTSYIAPDRIEQGTRHVHPELYGSPLWDIKGLKWVHTAWSQASMAWDALNYSWREWVVGYSNSKQSTLFSALGLDTDIRDLLPQLVLIALGAFLIFMLILAALLFSAGGKAQDPAQTQYLRFQEKLKRAGIQPLAHEGPLDLAQRVKKHRPDLEAEVQHIISLYIGQRFSPCPSIQGLRQLRQAVRRFRPKKFSLFV